LQVENVKNRLYNWAMAELEKVTHSDWFEIRENYDNVFSLDEYLDLPTPELTSLARELRLSVEEGALEYKRKMISLCQNFIESLRYDTRQFSEIGQYALSSTKLVYVILLQRLFAHGQLTPGKSEKESEELQEEFQEKDIKTIMKELQALVREEPSLTQKQEVKNILLQFKIYQKELEEMNKLRANIPKEKLPAFLTNFKNTIDGITRKVQDNYNRLLKEKSAPAATVYPRGDVRFYSLSPLGPVFQKQAETASRIRSHFLFAKNERFNTREIFQTTSGMLTELKDTLGVEEARYRQMEPGDDLRIQLIRSFTAEVIRRIEKNISTRI